MKSFFKLACASLLALLIVSSIAMADHKVRVVVQNEYKPDDGTVYVTEKTAPDLGLVTITAPTEGTQTSTTTTTRTESVYMDGKLVGETTKVTKMGIRTGYHNIEVRDADGNVVWTEPRLHVVKHETTVVYPQ